MNPALLNILILAAQEIIKHAPTLAARIGEILRKPNPTAADWDALRAYVKPYADYGIAERSAVSGQPSASEGGASAPPQP